MEISRNSYIPPFIRMDLKWYERDGMMTYMDQLKYKEFTDNRDEYVNHNQCRGDRLEKSIKEYNTITKENLKQMPPSEKNAAMAACFRSLNKNLVVEKSLAKEHFSCSNKNICRIDRAVIRKKELDKKYFECW